MRPLKLKAGLLIALLLLIVDPLAAQHLRRKCFLGIAPQEVPDSLKKAGGPQAGVYLGMVVPGGSLASLGAQAQDVLIQFNGKAVQNWDGLRQLAKATFEGDAVEVKVWRGGKKPKEIELKGVIVGAAKETSNARYDVLYDEAAFEGGWLRTIALLPKSPGPHPVIYFIPGYNCFSIDNMNANSPYHKMFDSLVGLGNIVYRVEKPGMGDGPNPCDCEVTGFEKELSAFEAGYKKLLTYAWAPEDRVFLFGHSMGGVQAPMLAVGHGFHPRGVAVYGTVFQSWYEYILNMLRFQEPRTDEAYLPFEADMKEYVKLFYEHYVLDKPIGEIAKNPKWKALLERDFAFDADENILYRRASYWQELARHSYADLWAQTDAHVLSMYGEADFEVFSEFSMSEITRIVNAYHPGKGKFVPIKGTDHGMIDVGSMEKGLALRGTPEYRDFYLNHFNYSIITEVDRWIKQIVAS
jgi:uncharacterized protein